MPRPLKRGILGASTIILSKDMDKYAFVCGSNFYETDVIDRRSLFLTVHLKPSCRWYRLQINIIMVCKNF